MAPRCLDLRPSNGRDTVHAVGHLDDITPPPGALVQEVKAVCRIRVAIVITIGSNLMGAASKYISLPDFCGTAGKQSLNCSLWFDCVHPRRVSFSLWSRTRTSSMRTPAPPSSHMTHKLSPVLFTNYFGSVRTFECASMMFVSAVCRTDRMRTGSRRKTGSETSSHTHRAFHWGIRRNTWG